MPAIGAHTHSHVLVCCLSAFSRGIGAVSKTHPESKCPELLANYCDLLLRKTPLSKKLTSEEIDAKLKGVVRFGEWSTCSFFNYILWSLSV